MLANACVIWVVAVAVVGIILSNKKPVAMRRCRHCGAFNRRFARYCAQCGSRLRGSQ